MSETWRRVRDGIYEHIPSGKIVERHDPPNNSHIAIWSVQGDKGANFSTLRDAKTYVERRAAPATTEGEPT